MKSTKQKLTLKEIKTTYAIFWRSYVKFKGITGRRVYTITWLINFLISIILGALVYASFVAIFLNNSAAPTIFFIAVVLLAIWGIGCFLPQLALTIRRLRDIGLSFWWYIAKLIVVSIFHNGLFSWLIELAFLTIMFLPSQLFGHRQITPAVEQQTSHDDASLVEDSQPSSSSDESTTTTNDPTELDE